MNKESAEVAIRQTTLVDWLGQLNEACEPKVFYCGNQLDMAHAAMDEMRSRIRAVQAEMRNHIGRI